MRIIFLTILFFSSGFCSADPLSDIEKKINSTSSWQSNFTQTTNGTEVETGRLYVQKPGKLRFIYESAPYTIYANGENLIYYDENIDQPTFIEIDQTPAALLLKNDLKFSDFGKLKNIEKNSDTIEIELELEDGSQIKLRFDATTLLLTGWTVHDFQGNTINVILSDIKADHPVDKNIFVFKRKRLAN